MSELERNDIYERILDSLQTGVCLVDRSQKIVFWNAGAEKSTGRIRQDVLGHVARDVFQSDQDEESTESAGRPTEFIEGVLRDGKPASANVMLRHKDGHLVPARVRAVAIRDDHGIIIGAAESFDENLAASEWDRRQETLAGYGALDSSTGVLTEHFVLAHLREALRTYRECQVPFSVISVRVDKLDELRARYGPGVIPVVLRAAGQTLENTLRPTDFLGRRGQADFLSIITECSRLDVDKICERLKRSVHGVKVNWWGDQLPPLTASLGAATVLPDDNAYELLARMDRSMEKSVAAGGNRITVLRAVGPDAGVETEEGSQSEAEE